MVGDLRPTTLRLAICDDADVNQPTHSFDQDAVVELLNVEDTPCVSIYQPTHRQHPDNQQDPIRFRNLVKEATSALQQRLDDTAVNALLKPLNALAADQEFWNCTLGGLAVLRAYQPADRFQVLALSRQEIKLFEGSRYALDEVVRHPDVPRTLEAALGTELTEPHLTVSSYGGVGKQQSAMHHGHGGKPLEADIDAERFFRVIDRALYEHHFRAAGLPLILATLPENGQLFREISRNQFLVPDGIDGNPFALSTEDLRERARQVVQRAQRQRLDQLIELIEQFGTAMAQQRGDGELANVARAVVAGRVATLMVEADREIPGRIDANTGSVETKSLADPETDDALDDLGALTLKMGGQLVIVPGNRMPTDTGLAAIYRY